MAVGLAAQAANNKLESKINVVISWFLLNTSTSMK
jgi:hypothetical protein